MDKKVNVLLSAYNGEKYIREQIESILEQSYKNIEIYVRDDGSKDGTLTILKEYEERGLIHLEAAAEGKSERSGAAAQRSFPSAGSSPQKAG